MPTKTRALLLFAAVACAPIWAAADGLPDFLVTRTGDSFAPGAASAWEERGGAVFFTLAAGVEAEGVAGTLRERLATASVSVEGGKLKISGVPLAALLDQLSALSLSGEGGDPLADLAGLGGAVAMTTPEGGGSIRATNAGGLTPPRVIDDHDPKERVEAEVLTVTRTAFPAVTLKLKLRGSPKAGPLAKVLRKGKSIEAAVVMAAAPGGGVDYGEVGTQRNLVAYYLAKGDRVSLHLVADAAGQLAIDFIERTP